MRARRDWRPRAHCSHNGVSVRLIDRAAGPAVTSRALGLQPRGAEVLGRLGALGDLPDRALPIHQVVVNVEGRELGRLAVGQPTALVQRPGLLASQTAVEGALRDRFTALGGTVEWGRSMTNLRPVANGVQVEFDDGTALLARWLVGSDGAHSQVRSGIGIEFPGVPLVERFLLADMHVDLPLPRDAVAVWLRGAQMLAAFPLPGLDLWRVMAPAPAGTEVDDDDVLGVLTDMLADNTGTLPAVSGCDWTSTFRIHRRLATTYRRGHVLLAGDAAHIHSPFGGQGMNTGLGDAENLAWKLALVVRGLAGEPLLDTYEAERRPVAEEVLASTSSLTGLVLGGSAVARVLRDRVLVPLMNSPRVQRLIWEQASQLKVSYRSGPLGGRSWRPGSRSGPRPGDRIADVRAVTDAGRSTRLHAELGGARWVVLAPATVDAAACTAAVRRFLGAERVTRLVAAEPSDRIRLVRPDAHLAWSGSDPVSLTRWLTAALDAPLHGRPTDPQAPRQSPPSAPQSVPSAPQSVPEPVGAGPRVSEESAALGQKTDRRQQRKQQTRKAIQEQALRLFLADGFESTTVERIADAAGVSHMTFFRHFPTKESVVTDDDFDPLIAALIRDRPAGEAPLTAIRRAIVGVLRALPAQEQDAIRVRTRLMVQTPALRARLWQNQISTQELFAAALAEREGGDGAQPGLRLRVLAGVALVTVTTALSDWATGPNDDVLADVIEEAFSALDS